MRRAYTFSQTIVTFMTLLAASLIPAIAGRGEPPAEKSAPRGSGSAKVSAPTGSEGLPTFELSNEVLARHPGVAEALLQIESEPYSIVTWRALGRALSVAGAHVDAIRALETAVRLAPEDADTAADLGAAQVRSGDSSGATSTLRNAIELDPLHALAHYNLGVAYQELDEYEKSLDEFELAFLIDPDLGDPKVNPHAVNNPHFPVIKLRIYMRTTGGQPTIFTPSE